LLKNKAAGGVLTAKQALHRPGTAPALGLRAGRAALIVSQTAFGKETPLMWFHSFLDSLRARLLRQPRRSRHRRPPSQPPPSRPLLEALEDRIVPSFAAAVNYTVGSLPQAVALGHFDAGSTLDLVVANYSTSNVSVLLGNSNSTFQDAKNSTTGSGPLAVAVGDFNKDGTSTSSPPTTAT
jgi:FG-GAP-like repeat